MNNGFNGGFNNQGHQNDGFGTHASTSNLGRRPMPTHTAVQNADPSACTLTIMPAGLFSSRYNVIDQTGRTVYVVRCHTWLLTIITIVAALLSFLVVPLILIPIASYFLRGYKILDPHTGQELADTRNGSIFGLRKTININGMDVCQVYKTWMMRVPGINGLPMNIYYDWVDDGPWRQHIRANIHDADTVHSEIIFDSSGFFSRKHVTSLDPANMLLYVCIAVSLKCLKSS